MSMTCILSVVRYSKGYRVDSIRVYVLGAIPSELFTKSDKR